MTRRMPTLLYVLAEAGSFLLLGIAVVRAAHAGWIATWPLTEYALILFPAAALSLVAEEWIAARLERRRARSPWMVLAGTVELEPSRPLAVYAVKAALRALFILAFGWVIGSYRPPSGLHLTPDGLALLYAFSLVQELIDRVSPLQAVLQTRIARWQACSRS